MALESLDADLETIDLAESTYRSRDRERLRKQIETGDLRAARDRMITQSADVNQ